MAKYINVVEDPRGRAMHGWSGDGTYDSTYDGVRLTWGDRAVVEVPHGQVTALLYVDTPSGLPVSVAVGASNLARGVSSPYLVDSGRTLRQVFSVTSGNGVAIDVYEPELEPVEPPIEDGEPETEPEPGETIAEDTVIVRLAVIEGNVEHSRYFDGDTADSAYERYEWLDEGGSLATILSRRKPCGVYFGTTEHAEWLASPDSGVPISLEGWGDNGTFLNGGAFVRRSATHHHRYNMSWTAISGEEVERIKAYFDGLYGQGPFHFVLPGTFHNVLPQSWSIPRLGGEGAPPLVVGHKPRMVPDHLATEGRPPASAHYTAIVEGQRRQVLTIPVPDDMVLHLGVRGSFSGTSMVYEVDDVQHELPPLEGSDLTNRMVVGPTFVQLSLQGEGVAIINSMTAALTPTFNPPTGRFRPGMGHSGVQFPHNGMSLSLDSAAKDLWSASVTLIETQQWR